MYSRQELAELGKRASDLYRHQGVPLTDAVTQVVRTTPNLTEHHVTRIIENANLITFEEEFKSSEEKHVNFELADPRVVHESREPKRSGTPGAYLEAPTDYRDEPDSDGPAEMRSELDSDGPRQVSFEIAMKRPVDKVAALRVNPEFEERQHLTRLQHAAQHIASELMATDSAAEYALAKLAHMVKAAALQANNAYAPLELIGYVARDEDIFEKIAHTVIVHVPQGLPRNSVGLAPNYDHPLAQQYVELEGLSKQASLLRRGLARIETERNNILAQHRFLRS
jgi:hypothetical protein